MNKIKQIILDIYKNNKTSAYSWAHVYQWKAPKI